MVPPLLTRARYRRLVVSLGHAKMFTARASRGVRILTATAPPNVGRVNTRET